MATTTTTQRLSIPTWIALALVIVGAINWGLVGIARFNLVAALFGELSILSRIVYVLVGLAGVYLVFDSARLSEPRSRAVATP